MSAHNTLVRLCRLRSMEEDQSRLELERTVQERNRVETQLEEVRRQGREARQDWVNSIVDTDAATRSCALAEMARAANLGRVLRPSLVEAEDAVLRQREEFLRRRTRRKQLETLADNARKAAEADAERRAQQMLDDWYGRKRLPTDSGLRVTGGDAEDAKDGPNDEDVFEAQSSSVIEEIP